MALEWREAVERMDVYLRELLSSGLLLLHAELGVDLGLRAELLPPGLLACVAAGFGLLLAALIWFLFSRCFTKKPAEKVAPESGKSSKPKSEEVKKRSRKRGDKKVQRNGLAVDLEEELKPAEEQNQNQGESPDPAGGKSDKGKKNKKKAKVPLKETKTPSTSERKEPEEAGTWETKVSHREKRQQRRKDKGAGDEPGSPGGTEPSANAAHTEHAPTTEEPKIILTPSVTSTTTTKTSNTKTSNTSTTSNAKTFNTKTSNTSTTTSNTKPSATSNAKTSNTSTTTSNTKPSPTSNTKPSPTSNAKTSNTSATSNTKPSTTTVTKTSTKNTKTTNPPAPKAQKNGQRTQQALPPVEHDPPVPEVSRAVIPPVSHAWDVMSVNGSGSWDLGVSVPPHTQTWNSVKSEPSVWPQDMEGSWMIVDGSHIPVSLHGMTAGVGVEAQVGPERPWACPAPVDDEWSGPNRASADPVSDYCAPCEEWGNYEEPAGGAVSPDEPQDSDLEKDKDEPAAPGSGKAKKKKKKKKKAEEAGNAAQVEVEVGVAKDQNTAGNILPKTTKEPVMVPLRVPLKPTEPEAPPKSTAPPTQKKPEESWESPKQVKKKKARRET